MMTSNKNALLVYMVRQTKHVNEHLAIGLYVI